MFGRSLGLRAMRQCQEGVGLSTERWYGDGVDGGILILGSKPGSGMGSGVECVRTVLKLDQLLLCT